MHPPTSHFQKCFRGEGYNFFIISKTFSIAISLTPQARIIENVLTKRITFGEARIQN